MDVFASPVAATGNVLDPFALLVEFVVRIEGAYVNNVCHLNLIITGV